MAQDILPTPTAGDNMLGLNLHTGGTDPQALGNEDDHTAVNVTNFTYYDTGYNVNNLNMRGFQIYLQNYQQQSGQTTIQLYLSPVLLVLGTIGNVTSYLVLRHKPAKQRSVFFYMALYALTNTLNLYGSCGLGWVSHITGTRFIANQADWLCRVWKFAFSAIQYMSTWLVVLMVFDRFIYLCIPSMAHSLCSVFTAKVLSCFVAVILIVISIHAMWTYEIVPEQNQCVVDLKRDDFQTKVWPIISAVIYSYLPLVIIISFDILIAVNLIVLNARQYQSRNFSPLQQQLTRVALVISLTFLLLTLPGVILNLVDFFNPKSFNTYESAARLYLGQFICELLQWLLFCLNFPQYFIALPLLRKELAEWAGQLSCRKAPPNDKITATESNGRLLQNNSEDAESKTNGITAITKL